MKYETRKRSMNRRKLGSFLAIVMLGVLGVDTPASTVLTNDTIVSNYQIPFTHTAAVSLGDTSELVDFTGTIHLVVTLSFPTDPVLPPSPIRVHTNVMNVSGVGQTSGLIYRMNGISNFKLPYSESLSFSAGYRIGPSPPPIREIPGPPPIRDLSFSVGYLVTLNSDGQLATVEAFPTVIEE